MEYRQASASWYSVWRWNQHSLKLKGKHGIILCHPCFHSQDVLISVTQSLYHQEDDSIATSGGPVPFM